MLRKTRGIVLHAFPYSESSIIFHCYTEDFGRLSLMGKGMRKSRKQNRSNLLQPLFLLDLEIYFKEQTEIKLVRELTRSVPLNTIPQNIVKSTQAIFIAEVLYRGVREEHENRALFSFLYNAIQYLDLIDDPDPDFHLMFLCQLSKYLGFFPKNNYSEENREFDPVNGLFKVATLSTDEALLSGSFHLSKMLGAEGLKNSSSKLTRENRKVLLNLLLQFYEIHVDGMNKLNSLEVLTSLFDNL